MMIENLKIQKDFNEAFFALENLIAKFSGTNFNEVPFEDSWTAGQVVQHVFLSARGLDEVLNGETKQADRDPEKLVEHLRTVFLNMDTKMKSPSFIDPEQKNYNKPEMLDAIKHIHLNVGEQIVDLDLTKICLSFEMPQTGYLSRFELLSFIIFHTTRHTIQLEKIYDVVKLS